MANIIVRELGPATSALLNLRGALYLPPKNSIAGINETLWPNPLQPVTPMGPPKGEPLSFNFNWGRNLIFTPREDAEYSAAELRQYGRYPLARICIENIKDMLTRMPWRVQLKPKDGETSKARAARSKSDGTLKKLNDFFADPNASELWTDFLRPVLDDLLVIDAPAIFVARSFKGDVAEIRWVEGSSITRLVDEHGWTPPPPSPAYQQLWQGYPRLDLTTDQLVYRPRNIVPRNTQSSFLYGMSPVEQMVDEIKVGMARLEFVQDFYSEGSIPGGMLFAPVGTPPDKIKEAQQFIDSDLAGQLAKRRRLQILQGFQKDGSKEEVVFPKEPVLADLFDEFHIRKICFAFGTSPQRLIKQMNRSSAQSLQDSAELEGTMPWMNWVKGTVDHIIQKLMKYPEYEFMYDPFHETDILKQAQADAVDVKIGLYTRNEKREDRGDDPRPEPEADELNVTTPSGVVGLDESPVKTANFPGAGTRERSKNSVTTATGSSGKPSGKSNGHSQWNTCEKHQGEYPRSFCSQCIRAELEHISKVAERHV